MDDSAQNAAAATPSAATPRSVRLPKDIRAVRNSEKYNAKGRSIVVCLDGTGDKFDDDNSNIVNIVKCLKKDDRDQITYYQSGIGTYGKGGLRGGVSAAMDMAVGSDLGEHVRNAYSFLMHVYKEHDKICIFGFSRGAYTARCLAGMVHKVGLLPARNVEQILFAYEFYKNDTPEGWTQSLDFKKTFCTDVSVYFLGMFDSVSSVGFIPRQLPLSSTPFNKPHYFRHAIALDERRAKFKVCRYQSKDWKDIEDHHKTVPAVNGSGPVSKGVLQEGRDEEMMSDSEYEAEKGHPKAYDTDVLEVWFPGCHSDVGGGSRKNWERHKLSNISLRWMIRQCFECKTGILFSTKHLAECGLDVHKLWPQYVRLEVPSNYNEPQAHIMDVYSRGLPPIHQRSKRLIPVEEHKKDESGRQKQSLFDLHFHDEEDHQREGIWLPEQIEDYFDALQPHKDKLIQAKAWWIVEFLPVEYHVQKTESDEWQAKTGMNLGRYRAVFEKTPKLHWTAQHRIQNAGYKMKARYGRDANWQIVA